MIRKKIQRGNYILTYVYNDVIIIIIIIYMLMDVALSGDRNVIKRKLR